MLGLQLLIIFVAAILLTAAQVFDEFITIIKNDRKKALFWGFLSWVLAGTIIVNIDGSFWVKTSSILFAGFGAAIGNWLGIELITILKKQKKTGKPFMKLLTMEFKKSVIWRVVKQSVPYKNIRKQLSRKKRMPNPQPEAIF